MISTNKDKKKSKKKSLAEFSSIKPTGRVTSQGLVAYEGHDVELPKYKKRKTKKRITAGKQKPNGKKKYRKVKST